MSLDRKIVSVSIKTGPPFEPGVATPLFDSPMSMPLPASTSHQTADDFSFRRYPTTNAPDR